MCAVAPRDRCGRTNARNGQWRSLWQLLLTLALRIAHCIFHWPSPAGVALCRLTRILWCHRAAVVLAALGVFDVRSQMAAPVPLLFATHAKCMHRPLAESGRHTIIVIKAYTTLRQQRSSMQHAAWYRAGSNANAIGCATCAYAAKFSTVKTVNSTACQQIILDGP
jgi:hypothetical protein